MRTLILGAGATGGYFGARMAAAGEDVTFLVRPKRALILARNGLVVTSPMGDLKLTPQIVTQDQIVAGAYDVIMLSCKAYDLDSAVDAIAPAVSGNTLILPLLNGLKHMDVLDARFGAAHVLGGLCHIGVTLDDDGTVRHLNTMQRFIVGPRDDSQTARAKAIHASIDKGGCGPSYSNAIMQDMWEKFVLLATYAGMTCLMRANIGAIMETTEGQAIMTEMLAECAKTATAAGYPPRGPFMAETTAMLTEKGSQGTSSMLRDVRKGARTEHDHILGDMLARARAAGVAAPILRLAYANLQTYAAMDPQR
jgi:2-dehydropantoate 2-reductase